MEKFDYIQKTSLVKITINTFKKIIYDFSSRTKTFPLIFSMLMFIGFYIKIDKFLENTAVCIVWLLVAFLFMGTGVGTGVLEKYIEGVKAIKGK